MWTVTWKLKLSKLCNLRCRYCYEWNELDRPDRLSLDDWVSALRAARSMHATMRSRLGVPGRTFIVLHGGEPMLLPAAHLERLLQLQAAVIGPEAWRAGEFANAIQTNLYAWDPTRIDLLVGSGFQFGVSFDGVPGMRFNVGGEETADRVAANLDRLLERTCNVRGAVVLGPHTHHRLHEIYRHFEARGVALHINRLVPSPLIQRGGRQWLDEGVAASRLTGLLVHWLDRGMPIEVEPLSRSLAAVLRQRAGIRRTAAPALAFIVEPDGKVYLNDDRFEGEPALSHVSDASRWIPECAAAARSPDDRLDPLESRLRASINQMVSGRAPSRPREVRRAVIAQGPQTRRPL